MTDTTEERQVVSDKVATRKPSLLWALSPLAYEITGVIVAVAGGALVHRSALAGGAMILCGVVTWLCGFGRVRRG